MQRYILFISLLALAAALPGIACLPGPGDTGARPQADVYYHTGEDDQHWYGTTRWAVFFDFCNLYTGVDSVQMEVTSALMYFPTSVTSGAATVSLYEDNANHQPGTQLATVTLGAVSPGWQEVDFPTTVYGYSLWLVLDCPTAENGPWVSASADDGTHSWWWDPNYGSNGWFRNMAACNYLCEFLFGLNGRLLFLDRIHDIELVDVSLVETPTPNYSLHFNYTVRNNAPVSWDAADLTFTITYPGTTGVDPYSRGIDNLDLGPYETITGSTAFAFHMPSYPCQLSMHANITNEDSTGISTNNSLDLQFDDFQDEVGDWLVENFVQAPWSQLEDWWAEEDILPDTAFVVNCFPDIADSAYYCPDSVWRFNYHGFMGYPACVLANEKQIVGYTNTFADSLAAAIEHMRDMRGFIELYRVSAATWSDGDIGLTLSFDNPQTHVLSSFLSNLRFNLVVVEENLDVNGIPIPGSVLIQRLSSDAGAVASDLSFEGSMDFVYTFNPGSLPTVNPNATNDDITLLWWFQHSDPPRILYAGHMSLADIVDIAVSVQDDPAEHSSIRLGPNPFSPAHPLTVSFSPDTTPDAMSVDVYNIRGQRVRSLQGSSSITWDGRDTNARPCASGVYLLRVSTRTGGRMDHTWKRCLLVK